MYGAIIYQKAPIVMRQLERILGPDKFQDGLRVYLKEFQFGNATWLDLIKILDDRTDLDLKAWSHVWVEEAGRPSIRTEVEEKRAAFVQSDPQSGRSLRWTQQMEVLLGTSNGVASVPLELQGERAELKIPAGGSRNGPLAGIFSLITMVHQDGDTFDQFSAPRHLLRHPRL